MLHDVFVDNVSKHDDEHGPHCTHMRWNCVEDDLHHACVSSCVPKIATVYSYMYISSDSF